MGTIQCLKSGNTNSQHSWACRTASSQICWQEQCLGNNSSHRCRTNSGSRNIWGSRTLDTTSQQPQVHPNQVTCERKTRKKKRQAKKKKQKEKRKKKQPQKNVSGLFLFGLFLLFQNDRLFVLLLFLFFSKKWIVLFYIGFRLFHLFIFP